MNNLAATLNAEKKVIGDALDAVGPAIDVLADQHDELIDMLGALEELGRVGTRVINASKEDVLKILDHLYPVLDKLHAAGHKLGPGVNLLVSFPFPKAANDIVQGDYADTTISLDIDFDNLLKGLGLPEIDLPDPGEVLSKVQRCLRSGSLTSAACADGAAERQPAADLRASAARATSRTARCASSSTRCPTSTSAGCSTEACSTTRSTVSPAACAAFPRSCSGA